MCHRRHPKFDYFHRCLTFEGDIRFVVVGWVLDVASSDSKSESPEEHGPQGDLQTSHSRLQLYLLELKTVELLKLCITDTILNPMFRKYHGC